MNPAGTGYIGRRILRVEDERLLRGHGNYTADAAFESLVHMVVLRSDHPAAEIKRIDAEAARAMHGVLGVWTGMDLCAEGLGGIPWEDRPPPQGSVAASELPPAGDPSVAMPQPVLASGCARYQGEPLAIVVAESAELARDAAEQIIIDYAPRPAVTDTRRAGVRDAPQVWPQFPGNRAFAIRCGDAALTDAAFARAAHVTRLSIDIPRLVQNPMEPRNYVGTWDAEKERYTLYAAAGKPQAVGRSAAREIFRIPSDKSASSAAMWAALWLEKCPLSGRGGWYSGRPEKRGGRYAGLAPARRISSVTPRRATRRRTFRSRLMRREEFSAYAPAYAPPRGLPESQGRDTTDHRFQDSHRCLRHTGG